MTREEIIEGLLDIHAVTANYKGDQVYLHSMPMTKLTASLNGAAELLRAQAPRLLTQREISAMFGKPAYLETKSKRSYSGWVLIYDVQKGLGITGVRIGVTRPGHVTIWPSTEIYGEKWRLWSSEPDKVTMETTPWKYISD